MIFALIKSYIVDIRIYVKDFSTVSHNLEVEHRRSERKLQLS